VRRSVLPTFFFLLAPLVLPSSATPAENRADRVDCTGYPEPRIYLENQSWWEPQARDPADPDHPGTGKQGHIHVGGCFPLWQKLSGDTLRLDLRLQLHNITGTAAFLQTHAYGDFGREVRPRSIWNGGLGGDNAWRCETSDCEHWTTLDIPLTSARYRGLHDFNIQLIVRNHDGQQQFNITHWPAFIDRPLPEPPQSSTTHASAALTNLIGVGGDSWFCCTGTGRYARVAMRRQDIPWDVRTGKLRPVSGVWRPLLSFEKQRGFAYIDPHLHAVPPHKGMVLFEELATNTGYRSRRVAIDTRKLTNGFHRLVFGTATRTPHGTHTGVGVIPFRVRNPRS
jgi:hypothetical protein